MRINSVSVKKLFGMFDHTIPLNQEERITIIHGPNGFGKTAILRFIDGLFNENYSALRNIPFESFKVTFEDQSYLEVCKLVSTQNSDEGETLDVKTIEISSNLGELFTLPSTTKVEDYDVGSISNSLLLSKFISLYASHHSGNPSEELNDSNVIEGSGEFSSKRHIKAQLYPKWFAKLKDSINVRFVKTERLFTFPKHQDKRRSLFAKSSLSETSVVSEYSSELASSIQSTLAEYAALSQSLDRAFPLKLVKQESPARIKEEEIRNRLEELEKKRLKLTEAGLLDHEQDVEFQTSQVTEINESNKNVLTVYVEDVEKKLSVFDELATKIDLFKYIVNERFQYKQMSVSKDKGITFTTDDEQPLSLNSLSSGEQHELVLFYELLFKVKSDSLVLIDEPEISLHVAWQEQFLRDLQKITTLGNFDVLIATHSPQIIADRWDLTVELKGPKEKALHTQTPNLPTTPSLPVPLVQ